MEVFNGLWTVAQHPGIKVLCLRFRFRLTTQKTAGQRQIKGHISWEELDMTMMSIVIEATALVLSGELDKFSENGGDEADHGIRKQ